MDGLKPVVEDEMILRAHSTSGQIANESNVFSISRGNSKVLSPFGSGLPARDLPSSLGQSWFKNVAWTTPGVGIAESLAIRLGAREDLNRSYSRFSVGGVIV